MSKKLFYLETILEYTKPVKPLRCYYGREPRLVFRKKDMALFTKEDASKIICEEALGGNLFEKISLVSWWDTVLELAAKFTIWREKRRDKCIYCESKRIWVFPIYTNFSAPELDNYEVGGKEICRRCKRRLWWGSERMHLLGILG